MNRIKKYFLISFLVLVLGGCHYDWIISEEVPTTPGGGTTTEVSFATQILPVFTANCIGCHKTGGTAPDLTAANAWNALNSTKYVNKTTPAESKIYKSILAGSSSHSHKTYTTAQAALILAWIQEGAKNN